jgi:hypothetical protein
VANVKIVVTDVLTSAMHVITILGDAGVTDACGYCHCSDVPKYVRDYNDLTSHCYCAIL